MSLGTWLHSFLITSAKPSTQSAKPFSPLPSSAILSKVRPEVRTLVALARLASIRLSNQSRDPLPYRHRRAAALFHVQPRRVAVPAGYIRRDAFFPDPWWTAEPVARDTNASPAAGSALADGSRVLNEARYQLTLLDGRKVIQVRRELVNRQGHRRKEFLAEIEGAHRMPFDEIPHALLPLYLPPQGAPNDKDVVVCEGIPAAQALAGRGIPAVATLTGALGTPSKEALRAIRERSPIVLWPDNDNVGVRHMQRIAERLHDMGVKDIRILRWAGAPRKADAADFSGSDKELAELVKGAAPWSPQTPVSSRGVLAVNPPRSDLRLRISRSEQPPAPALAPLPRLAWRAQVRELVDVLAPLADAARAGQALSAEERVRARLSLRRLDALFQTREPG